MIRPDFIFKLIAIGNNSVGKTSLLNNFVTKKPTNYSEVPTIGVDLHTTDVTIDNKLIRVHFWDTAGQEQFRSIIKNFYRGCAGAILVYDTTFWSSFNHLAYWVKEIREDNPTIPLIILGNKIDLVDKKAVTSAMAQRFADANDIRFFEVTAHDLNTIEPAIMKLMEDIYEQYKANPRACLGVREYSSPNLLNDKNASKCCNVF
jgi:small GTP-binding protein